MSKKLNEFLDPIRKRREAWVEKKTEVKKILDEGEKKARKIAQATLNEAMKVKSITSILKITHNLLTSGEHPVRIMALILSNVRFYYQILLLLKEQSNKQQVAKMLGKNPYFIDMTAKVITRYYSIQELETAFIKLQETDLAIKSGKIAADKALELAIVNIFNQKNLYDYTYNFDYTSRKEIISNNRRSFYVCIGLQL